MNTSISTSDALLSRPSLPRGNQIAVAGGRLPQRTIGTPAGGPSAHSRNRGESMRSALRLATLVLAATLVTSSAKADTIALTGGALFTGDSSMSGWDIGGLVTLEGDRGFTFLGSFLGGIVSPPEPLLPGRVTLRGVSNDIRATVT